MITISIISHDHGEMVSNLVRSFLGCPEVTAILVTLNVPEQLDLPGDSRVKVIHNDDPKGFGSNHNAAFRECRTPYFCPVNPDITLSTNPFPALLSSLDLYSAALVAPVVLAPSGAAEDSIRRFPTLLLLARRAMGRSPDQLRPSTRKGTFFPDWVAGMFLLFRSDDFDRLRGFDERFYLYYEDVDICVRAWKLGRPVSVCTDATVIHDARRASHRNLRHLRWHLASMARYFLKHWGRLPSTRIT